MKRWSVECVEWKEMKKKMSLEDFLKRWRMKGKSRRKGR